MIKSYLTNEQDEHLCSLAGAYMETPRETNKLSPNLMSIGNEIRLPTDLIYHFPVTFEPLNCTDHLLPGKQVAARRQADVESLWSGVDAAQEQFIPIWGKFVGPYIVKNNRFMNYVITFDKADTVKKLGPPWLTCWPKNVFT